MSLYLYLSLSTESLRKGSSVSFILLLLLPIHQINILISWTFRIRITHQLLNPDQNLFNSDGGFPVVRDDREAHGAGGENVGMGEGRSEDALRWGGWIRFVEF